MDSTLRKKLIEQNKLIKNKMNSIYNSKSTSNIVLANNTRYINNRYDRMKDLIIQNIVANYKKIFLDERWKQIIHAKRINRRLRGIEFKKEIDIERIKPYITGVISDIDDAIENGKKERYLTTRLIGQRNTQQLQVKAFLDEEEINQIINDASSYPEARKILLANLMDYVDEEGTLPVETKTGKTIHYQPKYYTNLVLRTVFREVQTQGTLAAANEVGSDLVQVSIHNTVCSVCSPFEGKIYSINGKNPAFPPLDDEPPYHPQCLHSLTVTFEEYLNIKGTYDDYVKFSNDQISSPPGVKNWTPIDERNVA